MKKSYDVLEINKVLEKFNKYLRTITGISLLKNLHPSNDKKIIIHEYKKLDELRLIFENYNDLPIYSKLDIETEIENLKKGNFIDGLKLNLLKDEIYSANELIKFFNKVKLDLHEINRLFSMIKPNLELYQKIIQTVGIDNNILDSASKELFKIRSDIRNIDKKIHSTINGILNSNKDKINGDNYVIRNGHFALPINSNLKGKFDGIVHDISDSGATTFIEPYEIAQLENEKSILQLKERDEISRILDNFRKYILFDERQLLLNNKIIGELDFLMAKVKYIKEYKAIIPLIEKEQVINFKNAKHPLLDLNTCVPNNFIFGKDKKLMLISGPNAGGKTIALKTIGTLAYLVKMALPLTCEEGSSCGIFSNIYCDIGDNQSIENNLSTFSSQISNLSSIIRSVCSKDLVILDELCNGTDPKEGEALAIAITKYLLNKSCLSVITSHYSLLKQFGLQNENILSASFIFDERKIRPTFKMLLGVSGKSFGFLIANKFGIDKEIVEDAKKIFEQNYLSEEDRRIEIIEEKERALTIKEEKLKKFESRLSNEQSKIDIEKNKIKIRTEKLNQNKSEEFDKYLDAKYKEINDVYKEFLKEKNAKKALEKLAKINIDESSPEDLNLGDYVELKGIEAKGQIVKINNNKITINTEDGFTINTKLDAVKKIPIPKKLLKASDDIDNKILNQKTVSDSLNLLGYRAYEGVEAMENYISEALASNRNSIRVIHGYGTGRLREALWEALKKNKHVESFTLGNETNGGTGSTIIKLK